MSTTSDRYGSLQDAEALFGDDAIAPEADGLMRAGESGSRRTANTIRAKVGGARSTGANETAAAADVDAFVYTTPPSGSTDGSDDSEDDEEIPFEMSIAELLYSSSSYYAIAKPVTLTMILAALSVCFINTDETRSQGAAAMATYQVWNVSDAHSASTALATSLANALVIVSFICCMTFVIVCLYRFKFMKCLIGYMVFASGSLLGLLGGNLAQTAIGIYKIPVDKVSFGFFMFNFAFVGVVAVFWGQGVPKMVTQAYLICTSVILAWHLSYFDDWTTWTLLFMLAVYDLCAVLTPCGPLKALVNLMSKENAPEMPGLLFEADLPPEAKRPTRVTASNTMPSTTSNPGPSDDTVATVVLSHDVMEPIANVAAVSPAIRTVKVPLAIAKVYQLTVISCPKESLKIMFPSRFSSSNVSASPLLSSEEGGMLAANLPEYPTPQQLRADVIVQLPPQGGSIELASRRGRKVYLERDRHGLPKRMLWVDHRSGKVFAEIKSDDDEGPERNSIRLGLGDFIFYSVLVAKAAQYSFSTFAVCTVVILSGLGGTLVLLSVYGQALPALPISIFLGVFFYVTTRLFMESWIEMIVSQPFYA
jgi:presenilin 1